MQAHHKTWYVLSVYTPKGLAHGHLNSPHEYKQLLALLFAKFQLLHHRPSLQPAKIILNSSPVLLKVLPSQGHPQTS